MPSFCGAGIEVGVWINGFGHGMPDITMYDEEGAYQGFVGEDGSTPRDCFCPSDLNMQRDFADFVRKIAAARPSILMIDDDFRLGQRSYALGCFCPNHMADICARLGECLSREELVEKIYSGGPNRYRDAYMASMSDTLIGFAKMLRAAVDVRVFEPMHKLKDSDFGELYPGYSRDIVYSFFSRGQYPLSHNGISTVYYGAEGAVAAFGENARQLPKELIKNGVITDCIGAKILTERGFDAGYVSSEHKSYLNEAYPSGEVIVFDNVSTCKMTCSEKAVVTSVFTEDNSPASYKIIK